MTRLRLVSAFAVLLLVVTGAAAAVLSALPLNLPAGWDFAKVFGERAKPLAPPAERRAELGNAHAQLASLKRPVVRPEPSTVVLPKTATDAELSMIAGSVLLALSLILFVFTRRQTFARNAG